MFDSRSIEINPGEWIAPFSNRSLDLPDDRIVLNSGGFNLHTQVVVLAKHRGLIEVVNGYGSYVARLDRGEELEDIDTPMGPVGVVVERDNKTGILVATQLPVFIGIEFGSKTEFGIRQLSKFGLHLDFNGVLYTSSLAPTDAALEEVRAGYKGLIYESGLLNQQGRRRKVYLPYDLRNFERTTQEVLARVRIMFVE